MNKKLLIPLLVLLVTHWSVAAVQLTGNGQAACSIVLAENAGPVEQHAARELAKFLAKISGCTAPEISGSRIDGKYPVYLQLTDDPTVKAEGFLLDVKPDAMIIAGRGGIGTLYGVYEVLKKYGGIRWLIPGEAGEYFTPMPAITVPEGRTVKNPDFQFRDVSKVCMANISYVIDTWDWLVRNNGRIVASLGIVNHTEKHRQALTERGVISKFGGHSFSPLLHGTGLDGLKGKDARAKQDQLFAEHPEYFPLINGKRTMTRDGGVNPQPCTSHPDVIEIVANNALRWLDKAGDNEMMIDFGNNDTTAWCQCPNCVSQDPPVEKERRVVSTRYWLFANAVLDKILQKKPDARFAGWSYQNFSDPPTGVKPDLRVTHVMISNHRRCWKHALNDPNCPTNRWYYDYNKKWNAFGVPLHTYEELSYAGYNFLPNEKSWVDTLKFYHRELPNLQGMRTEICCPDGRYGPRFNNFKNLNNWSMMWQAMYMGMNFMWDVNADFDKVHEEINALYYGSGWQGGIREFRALLRKLYMEAGGCWGYGHSIPVGKFLDVPGAKEKLYQYLDSAEKAAAADTDPRALHNVKNERVFFEATWIKAHQEYISNFREIKVYPLQGEIVIDGKLDEADWKNADVVTRFKKTASTDLAQHQTAVKLAYDKDNLYIAIECLEPEPDKMKTLVKEHDGPVWEDNDVEIFLNDPILGGSYFQIMVNAAGVICDGMANPRFSPAFNSNMEVKTSIGDDRWFLEARQPIQPITGGQLTPGFVLKMNVMRHRVIEGDRIKNEVSTWSTGTPHNVETFHPITFAEPRAVAAGNRTEIDTRLWKNGSFNEVRKDSRIPAHWTVPGGQTPAAWSLSSAAQYGGDLEFLQHPDRPEDRFVRLRKGFIFQSCGIRTNSVLVSCRLRGKGQLRFMILRYTKTGGSLPSVTVRTEDVDSAQWINVNFEFVRPGEQDENWCMALFPGSDSEIDVDDIFLIPR